MIQFKKIPPVVYVLFLSFLGLSFFFGRQWLTSLKLRPWESESLLDRRSLGAIAFSQANASPNFLKGNEQFKRQDYTSAIQSFRLAMDEMPDHPIPSIYHQNAILISQNHIKIAAVVPLGSNRNVALEMLRGIAIAQETFNQKGHKVVVEIFNDDNDPDVAKVVATEIVADTSIKAVVGHNASNVAIPVAPIYEKAGIVMITPTSFDTALSDAGDYIYRTTPNIRHLVNTLVDYSLNRIRRKKISVCYDSDAADNMAFKQEFINILLEQGGQYIPTDCDFSLPSFDPETQVRQLISDGADAVLLVPHIDRLDRLIDLSKANRWHMVLLGSPSLETEKILDIGQGDLNGVVIPVPYHQDMPTAQPFVKQVQAKFGVRPTWRTFASMDAMVAILKESTASDQRSTIQNRLKNPDFQADGSTELIRFLPTGDRIGNGVLVQIKPQARGYRFEMLPQS